MTSRIARLGAGLGSVMLLLAATSQVQADVGVSSNLSLAANGLTVYATGSWAWPIPTATRDTKFVGYAIDWGDVTSGNALGSYHLGDGTAATNQVLVSPERGSHGTYGPVSHTYKVAGSYKVCAIVYDLGSAQPIRTTGWHSLRATGPNRNTDNSIDQQTAPAVACATINVTPAAQPSASTAPASASPTASGTPAPEQSVGGATFAPGGSTLPPTATDASTAAGGGVGGFALPLGLALLSGLGAVFALAPRRRRG